MCEFNPELCDIFSLGITLLRLILILNEDKVKLIN